MSFKTTLPDLKTVRRDMVRRQLRTLLWFYGVAAMILLVVGLVTGDDKSTMLSTANLGAWAGLLLLQRADRLQAAGLILCTILLGTGTYATMTSRYGLLDSTIIIFAVVSICAVLILDRRFWIPVLVLTVVDVFVIGYRTQLGLYPSDQAANILLVDPVIVAVVVLMLAVAVRRQHNHLWEALGKSLYQEQALQQQAEQLQASERRWRTLVHAAPEWIMQVDREAVIRFSNLADRPDHADDVGRPLAELVVPVSRTSVTAAMCDILAGRHPAPLEVDMVLHGETRHCLMNLGPLEGADDIAGAIVLISDETDRRDLQLQLEQAQRLDSLGRLAGGIAHDFNNLLTVISGHTDLAATSSDMTEDLTANLDAIRDACDRASTLTGQILAFGRRQPQQAQPLDLNDTVDGLTPMLRRLIGEDIGLNMDLEEGLPPVVADAAQLEQVVVNLVINARDAVRDVERAVGGSKENDGRRHITVSTRRLDDDAESTDRAMDWIDEPLSCPGVVLKVADTGSGMEEPVRRRAFEPFFTTKPKGEGSGLGLAMVYGITKQNRGAIRIDSRPGRGTSVHIALPVSLEDVVQAKPDPEATTRERIGRGEHILLVEDDEAVRELTSKTLSLYGYGVTECAGMTEALQAVDRHDDLAAVVTDIIMPGGSGLEMAARLPRSLPVLFTSGYASETSRETIASIPDGQFLQKPFLPLELATRLRQILDQV